ncbi:hypothetical protein BIW11_09019 [Tropilaelaps mercedesae]|uniref:Monocarboxylate transporter n=1 Tax=Tropilaelaps mercedesae TaxID=418985 RepID=A0A1V9XM28_9ACAR|nr:hypothetical protein BIW11_09019 [Tropilaelaps mercedesae]
MQPYGPDSRRSWAAVVLAGLVQIPVLFSLKTMGVIFVGLLSERHLSRQNASWPLTLFIVSSQIFAPVLPLLQRFMPAFIILPLSCTVSAVSLMLSYFAKNLTQLSIVLAVHGFSLAAIYIFSTFLLMQYFKSKRTAATVLTSTMSTACTIFAPNAMQALVLSYGVRYSLVIIGAAGLIVIPFSIGLKTPNWYSDHDENGSKIERQNSCREEADDFLDAEKGRSVCVETSSARSRINLTSASTFLRSYWLTPLFLIHVISVTVTYNSMNLFLLLAFDHALDVGIATSSALYVLPAYCCGDLVARFFSGIAIDLKWISWQAVLALGYTIEVICLVTLALNSSRVILLLLSFIVGCTCGAKVSLVPVQLANDFGLNRLVSSSGSVFFICGCVAALRPWFVGYFRDVCGSYKGLFLVVACCCALCSAYWLSRVTRSFRENLQTRKKLRQEEAECKFEKISPKNG